MVAAEAAKRRPGWVGTKQQTGSGSGVRSSYKEEEWNIIQIQASHKEKKRGRQGRHSRYEMNVQTGRQREEREGKKQKKRSEVEREEEAG